MKTNYKKTIAVSILLIACVCAFAATKQWSVDAGAMIYQTVIDGKGGCSFMRGNTNGTFEILRVDKKGAVNYQKVVRFFSMSQIISATPKELVYGNSTTSGVTFIVHVDKKGNETEIMDASRRYWPPWLPGISSYNSSSDKKGFFVQSLSTNYTSTVLERYTYK